MRVKTEEEHALDAAEKEARRKAKIEAVKNQNFALARDLFFRYVDKKEISRLSGISIPKLNNAIYAKDGWLSKRDASDERAYTRLEKQHAEVVKEINSVTLDLILWGVKEVSNEWRNRDKTPSIFELEALGRLGVNYDKLKRLDAGDPTDIKVTLTPQEVLQTFMEDPYFNLSNSIEAEVVTDDDRLAKPHPLALPRGTAHSEVDSDSSAPQTTKREMAAASGPEDSGGHGVPSGKTEDIS